jgi:ribosomal protein S18 acetylase RimI-like enzyme
VAGYRVPVLRREAGLDDDTLREIAALEARCLEHDGGRLKLEWRALRTRKQDDVNDLLWYEGDQLTGFCARYAFGDLPEATGMVDPAYRRRGIGRALLEALLTVCSEHGDEHVLLVAPRSSTGAKTLAERHGGVFHHAEHALVLTQLRGEGEADPHITLRLATARDAAAVADLIGSGFGESWPVDLDRASEVMLLAERGGHPIATVRVTTDDDGARGIYGFVVAPSLRGRGIGRDILRRICREALDGKAPYVHLEVEVANDRALNLYTSVGFGLQNTEDYYEIAVCPDG